MKGQYTCTQYIGQYISLDISGSVTTDPSATATTPAPVEVVAEIHRPDEQEEFEEEVEKEFLLNPDDMGEDGEDVEEDAKEGNVPVFKRYVKKSQRFRPTCRCLHPLVLVIKRYVPVFK